MVVPLIRVGELPVCVAFGVKEIWKSISFVEFASIAPTFQRSARVDEEYESDPSDGDESPVKVT